VKFNSEVQDNPQQVDQQSRQSLQLQIDSISSHWLVFQ
jgi:hypothetical protein